MWLPDNHNLLSVTKIRTYGSVKNHTPMRGTLMGKGSATRNRILDITEAAVLEKGFGATSIDEVIAEDGLTKSGFFYHFQDKNTLARRRQVREKAGYSQKEELDESHIVLATPPEEVLAIHNALGELEEESPNAAVLVKLRYFAGMTLPEAANAMNTSLRNVRPFAPDDTRRAEYDVRPLFVFRPFGKRACHFPLPFGFS